MIPLNKLQKSQIKAWMQDESYSAVFQFYKNKLESIKEEEITGMTEFETLRQLHKNQGKVEALTTFFEDLDKQAYE
jgi:hypothetical protein